MCMYDDVKVLKWYLLSIQSNWFIFSQQKYKDLGIFCHSILSRIQNCLLCKCIRVQSTLTKLKNMHTDVQYDKDQSITQQNHILTGQNLDISSNESMFAL